MPKGTKGFQPGNSIGKVFTQSRQPQKRGRKPALYRQLLNKTARIGEIELSKEDYFKVIRFLMERTPGELKKILADAKDEEKGTMPVWVINIISALFSDVKAGRITTINMVFDRLFGKATQIVEGEIDKITTHRIEPNLSVLSNDELILYHQILLKTNDV